MAVDAYRFPFDHGIHGVQLTFHCSKLTLHVFSRLTNIPTGCSTNHNILSHLDGWTNEERYSLELTITDTGGLSASIDILVTLNTVNEAPVTVSPDVFLDETALTGATICAKASVSTSDPDSGSFTYSLEDSSAYCATCAYVDSTSGDDDANDGSEAAPFKTIIGAQQAASGSDVRMNPIPGKIIAFQTRQQK